MIVVKTIYVKSSSLKLIVAACISALQLSSHSCSYHAIASFLVLLSRVATLHGQYGYSTHSSERLQWHSKQNRH